MKLTTDGNLWIAGDLQVGGNDILDSSGNAVITFNGSGQISSMIMAPKTRCISWALDSLNGINWASVAYITDTDVVTIAWERNAYEEWAIQVLDITNSIRLFGVKDSGDTFIQGDLQVKGNDIKDSGGNVRITLGFTIILNGDLKVAGNDILDSGGTVKITLGNISYYNSNQHIFRTSSQGYGALIFVYGNGGSDALVLTPPAPASGYWNHSPVLDIKAKYNDAGTVYDWVNKFKATEYGLELSNGQSQ